MLRTPSCIILRTAVDILLLTTAYTGIAVGTIDISFVGFLTFAISCLLLVVRELFFILTYLKLINTQVYNNDIK
jgi:hypothetical protein